MHWAGVPIIVAVSHLNKYMQSYPFTKFSYQSLADKRKCEEDETHRKAFMNRINFH